MAKKIMRDCLYALFIAGLTLSALSAAQAADYSNINPQAKWAWSSNAGWINFSPPNGGVTVCDDHLIGYAWGENVGWIRLGTATNISVHDS